MASSQAAPGVIPEPLFAGLGRRAVAYLIDLLIAIAVLLAAGFTMRLLRAVGVWTAPSEPVDPQVLWRGLAIPAKLAVIIAFVVSMGPIYLAFFEASAWQASIGKRLLDIYVTDEKGRRLALARSFGRSFAKCFSKLFYVALVSVATIVASTKKQALHDFAARTFVVCGRPAQGGSLELWRVVAAFGIPFLWLLATFLATV